MSRDVMVADFEKMLQAEFAEDVTITTPGHNPLTVKAIYDKTYQMVDPESQSTVLSTRPRVTVASGLVTFPITKMQTTVLARGKTWRVREKQDDDEGATTLCLE